MSNATDSIKRHKPYPMVRLGDVCVVRAGGDYKTVKSDRGEYPIYGTGGKMGMATKCRCPANSVIIGRKGTLDNPMLIREPFWNIDTCFGVTPSSELNPEYLWRFCQQFDFYSLVPASGRPSTTSNAIKSIPIPLPPLSIQHFIVSHLQKTLARVDALKAQFEKLRETAATYFKSALKETFDEVKRRGAETQRLEDVFKFIDYRGMTPEKIESGIPLITAKNVRMGFLDYSDSVFISEEDYSRRQSRGVAHKGDILFTTEAPLGCVALADKEVFSTGQRIITFQWLSDETHDNKYFYYYLLSPQFQKALWEQATGATAKGIKSSRLANLNVIKPIASVQKEIACRLDAIKHRSDRIGELANKGLELCETMRKAVLKEAFQ